MIPGENMHSATQLVVPAKNFTDGFQHVGQRGIKAILDRNNVVYKKKMIIQASNLKENPKCMNIKHEGNLIFSIDAMTMHPLVKLSLSNLGWPIHLSHSKIHNEYMEAMYLWNSMD